MRTVTQEIRPPDALLAHCERPRVVLETNADLARLASELAFRLDVCASQIDALRVYFGLDLADSDVYKVDGQ